VGSCARRFGLSGRPVLRWQGHAGPRSHLHVRRRPRQVRPGVYGFESRAARARPVRRRSGPRRLHSDGLRPRAWSTPTATSREKWKPYGAAGRRPRTVGQPAKPTSPPSGEAVRAGLQDRALPPHSSLPNGPACDRRPPVVKTRGGLKKTGRRPLRRKPVGTDKKRPRTAHGQHEKIFGTGCDSAIPAIQPWTNGF
jgi:hypothetical protein